MGTHPKIVPLQDGSILLIGAGGRELKVIKVRV